MTQMTNAEFDLAEQFALYTRKHCFITGKAGTGKTTLLKRIVDQTQKNVVVVAPTGVAAINAGGVTIHSMFGLPLTCFVPGDDDVDLNIATTRRRLQYDHMHFRKDKLRVIQEMDTLIIDEVSMVRADLLDAVDFVMRSSRRNRQPFGDVQVLLFGDMHQLPPVVKDPEWSILSRYYQSPYFFDSLVWQQMNALEIELKTIYRQSDERFLTLLSHVRDRKLDADDYELLKKRYNPEFKGDKGYVLLSTHNNRADSVNASELAKLPGRTVTFEAEIDGDFPDHMFPCDQSLNLKPGAQVMFIRNDSEEGVYYNGKLAVVKRIDRDGITVTFNDTGREYELHPETWENIEYSVDPETGNLLKKELGAFIQYPLRLAWAITIHKSQGLTFDNVIVDAGRSFAAGQVYVALSRCRTLEGIVLHSLITPAALRSDQRICKFSAAHDQPAILQEVLVCEKSVYANRLLLRLFAFTDLSANLGEWEALITKKDIPDKDDALALHARICEAVKEINVTAEKFQRQLQRIIAAMETDQAYRAVLKERCEKAIRYFTDQIAEQIIKPLRGHINNLAFKKKMKRYLHHVQLIEEVCWIKVNRLYEGTFNNEKLYNGQIMHRKDELMKEISSATSGKTEKGATFNDTLQLYRQGKKVAEIAAIRGLTVGTVTSHLAKWIEKGEVNVYDILPAEMVDAVLEFVNETKLSRLSEIRSALGDRYEYSDLRMVMSHALRKSNEGAAE